MDAHTLSRRNRPGSRRNRPGRSGPRRALALAALSATALLVAACGGNSPPGATGSAQYDKALAFSKCMRSHGALGFPDPTSQGTITVTQALLNNPQIQSAAPSCKNLLPRGAVQLPAALQRKFATQALQYAACMRSHGVPNFPDPIIHGGTISFRVAAPAGAAAAPQSSAGAASSKSAGSGPKPPAGRPRHAAAVPDRAAGLPEAHAGEQLIWLTGAGDCPFNAVDPGPTDTDLTAGRGGRPVEQSAEVIVRMATIGTDGPTRAFQVDAGEFPAPPRFTRPAAASRPDDLRCRLHAHRPRKLGGVLW